MDETWELVGRVVFTDEGAYSASASYTALDVVTNQGKTYIAIQDTQGNAPVSSGADPYWQLLANAGTYQPSLDSNGILI